MGGMLLIFFKMTITHIPLEVTATQRENLERLADYLDGELKEGVGFDMLQFTGNYHETTTNMTNCGSVGCAVGHGPYAGIPKDKGITFPEYCRAKFTNDSPFAFAWMFSEKWAIIDNSQKGAAARIKYALYKGIPVDEYGWMVEKNTDLYKDYTL